MNKPDIALDMEDEFDEKKDSIHYSLRGLEVSLNEIQVWGSLEDINNFGEDILSLVLRYKEIVLLREKYKNNDEIRKYNQLNEIFIKKQLASIFGEKKQ